MENNKKFKVIPQEIKEQILGRINNEGVTVVQAAADHAVSTKTIYNWLARQTGEGLSWGELNRLKRENRELKELIGQLSLMMEKTKTFKKNQSS